MQMATSLGSSAPLTGKQPVAALVLLADADRLVGGAVKLFADLDLDQRALFLDHDDEVEALGEFHQFEAADRPRAADLVETQAEVVALDLVEAELVERLADVEIALADGDDADLGVAPARADHAVELVRPHEGQHGVALEVVQARFLAEHGVAEPDVEPARRHREVVGDDDLHAVEAAVDHGGRTPPSRACI